MKKLRTINKILGKNYLSGARIEFYKELGIINGCGGKGGVDFDKILKDNIQSFTNFKKEKLEQLLEDIKQICYNHDLDFNRGGGIFAFYYANFKFGIRLARLLTFAGFFERVIIFIIAFGMLNKFGKKYFNF